jgi:hypothetical protein
MGQGPEYIERLALCWPTEGASKLAAYTTRDNSRSSVPLRL